MSKRKPIRIIVPNLDMSLHDQSVHSSNRHSATSSRPTYRAHVPSAHAERRHRRERSRSRSANPDIHIQSPSPLTARDTSDAPPSVGSPPIFRGSPSPSAEPALIPGGGVEIPRGFRFNEADHGHYRPREFDDGDPENARVLGRMGLGMFKGLKKIPAAIVKAGRSYGPRNQDGPSMPTVPESDHEADERLEQRPGQLLRDIVADQGEVETYLGPEDEEAHAREEQLLHDYIQRKRMGRDRAFRKRGRRERYQRPAPPPQPVLVPGAHSPAPSQVSPSQAGHSDIPPTTLEARLEAEEMQQEREELEQAHERERARKVYAADVVRPPPSSLSSDPQVATPDSYTNHHHYNPMTGRRHYRPSSHVVSRWSAERDTAGRRRDNGPEEGITGSSLVSSVLRFIQHIRDLPWVGDRVAADYVPGGSKPKRTPRYYTSSLGSDVRFSSPTVTSAVGGPPLPVHTIRPPNKPGPSWYSTQDEVLVLPIGVEPPPGFIPYPFPEPQPARSTTSANGEGAAPVPAPAPAPAPSHANMETVPSALRPAGPTTSTPEAGYLTGEAYQFLPAQVSKPGQPSIYVPMGDGRHQPLIIPGLGTRPAYVYSHPGPPSFVPASR